MGDKGNKATASALELADIFERMMQQLTLLGHTVPQSATSLTPQQLKILFVLHSLGEPTPMSKLSAQLNVTPGTLTKVAGGLIKKRYLDRRRSAEDDRVVKLSLTKEGHAVVAQIRKYRQQFFAEICARLNAAECRKLIESHRNIHETYRQVLAESAAKK
ncbi:MAG TPA: MarR family transcriptional regulator [Bryobacteraceae bacterium]|nr:MarR family transcriptional regulator [Bryobacteraceae bacterium]